MNNTPDPDRLYSLLPSVYRQRDADMGWQLKALLQVIAEQVNVVEADITQLSQNWFIETCQDWVIPYIGDLLGYQQVRDAGEPSGSGSAEEQLHNKIVLSRREVANALAYRRRRGTPAVLEQLARDVAGWPALAVEFYKHLEITQSVNYRHRARGRSINVHNYKTLFYLGSPFGREAHTVDVRRIASQHVPGRYNLPNIGIFAWRLKVYSVPYTPAYCKEDVGTNCYTFSVLGNDTQLYTHPTPPTDGPPDELAFPAPIERRDFERRLNDYYGADKSLYIWTIEDSGRTATPSSSGHPSHTAPPQFFHGVPPHYTQHAYGQAQHGQHGPAAHQQHGPQLVQKAESGSKSPEHGQSGGETPAPQPVPVTPDRIVAADLSEWRYRPRPGQVAVDPVLGRIVFPPGHAPHEVIVSYYYGFSADIGGGVYNRPILQPATCQLYQVGKTSTDLSSIQKALDAWAQWKAQNAQQAQPAPYNAVIEIVDSGVYTEQLAIELEEYESIQIRAANWQRPVIRLIDWDENRPDSLKVAGEYGSRFALDGLLITGRGVQCEGDIAQITLRHCTLVPGWGLHSDCEPQRPAEPSLSLYHVGKRVSLEHSIVGALLVYHDEVRQELLNIDISDSIIDATSTTRNAISAPEDCIAPALLTIVRSTIFGKLLVHALSLGENSIFQGQITVARRQLGCMRFCSLLPGSRTPRRYNCQPDLVEQAVDVRIQALPPAERASAQAERAELKAREDTRVRPLFNSVRYGTPTYCQLALFCAPEIRTGADDESEMGVFHDLFQPQRAANLTARSNDFTPADMQVGIIYMS